MSKREDYIYRTLKEGEDLKNKERLDEITKKEMKKEMEDQKEKILKLMKKIKKVK